MWNHLPNAPILNIAKLRQANPSPHYLILNIAHLARQGDDTKLYGTSSMCYMELHVLLASPVFLIRIFDIIMLRK